MKNNAEFNFSSIGTESFGEINTTKYSATYVRVEDLSRFEFKGKIPSRRIIREMVKEWEKLQDKLQSKQINRN